MTIASVPVALPGNEAGGTSTAPAGGVDTVITPTTVTLTGADCAWAGDIEASALTATSATLVAVNRRILMPLRSTDCRETPMSKWGHFSDANALVRARFAPSWADCAVSPTVSVAQRARS